MPIYCYSCEACQKKLEAIQRLSDPPLAQCPDCKGSLKKELTAANFEFKGKGFYCTDYGRSKISPKGAPDTGSKASS